jgi:TetR/AcrR family transcriptional regulator, cholesterol catabolism regulator
MTMASQNPRAEDVLLEAARLFQEHGFEATTVGEISSATGLTKGGLYHYIESKEDLLYRIMCFAMQQLKENVVAPVSAIADSEEQLRALVKLHIGQIAVDKGVLTILAEETESLTPEHRKDILRYKREHFAFARDILQRLRKQGRLRSDVDTTVATFSILGMILFVARWYRVDGRMSSERIGEEIAALALNSILRPQP